MLVVKSIKWTLIDGSIETAGWHMLLHRIVDENSSASATLDGLRPVYLEFKDTVTGKVTKYTANRYSKLISLLKRLKPYGFVDTDVHQYRGDFVIVLDKMALDFLDCVKSVDFIDIVAWDDVRVDNVMRNADVSFCQLDEHGTLFAGDSINGTFACTLLDAMCLVRHGLVDDYFYLPFTKTRMVEGLNSYQAFRVSFSDVQLAKRALVKAFTLRGSSIGGIS